MLSKDQEAKNVAGLTGKHLNSAGLWSGRARPWGLAGLPTRCVAATAPSQDDEDKAQSPV